MKKLDPDSEPVRVTITLPVDLLSKVDEHWHARRLGSRSEAVRDLVVAGLGRQKIEKAGKTSR